jgi:RNA polymerase sigma-70 factor (ECF subfamily)
MSPQRARLFKFFDIDYIYRSLESTNLSTGLSYEDAELIILFQQGERAALHAVYERFMRPLCYFADQMIEDTMASEDIVSECFIQAFKRKEDFPSIAHLKSFLYTSARNAALNHLKAQKRHGDVHLSLEKAAERLDMDVERAYIKTEVMQLIFSEIEKLPPRCRDVVRLAIVDGKNAREIAEELNMAYQTVLNQKTKGVGLLRTALLKNELISLPALIAALSLLQT